MSKKIIIIIIIVVISAALCAYFYVYNQARVKEIAQIECIEEGETKNENTIYLAAPEYVPYYGSELENGGFISEVIVEAYKRSGYNVEFSFMPWSRALEDAKRGSKDGIYTLWYREDREEFFVYSNPIPVPNKLMLATLEERHDINFENYYDLQDYTTGVVQDYTYPDDFLKSQTNFSWVTGDAQNIRKLFAKRVDVIAIDQLQGVYIARNEAPEKAEKLRWLTPAISIEEQYVGISRQTENFEEKLAAFNQGLQEVVDDGTFAKILEKRGFDYYELDKPISN